MKIQIYEDYKNLSQKTAEMICNIIKNKPDALLCFAAGNTQDATYEYLAEYQKSGEADFSRVRFVGLDEWVGMGREDKGSCTDFMYKRVFNPLKIPESNIDFFNARSEDLAGECTRIDNCISKNGPVDVMLLGLGMSGHLGMNEPGTDFNLYSHITELEEITKAVGQKYFDKPVLFNGGITLGIRNIMESKTAIMQVSGEKKAELTRRIVQEDVTPKLPAGMMRLHNNGYLMLDSQAASLI